MHGFPYQIPTWTQLSLYFPVTFPWGLKYPSFSLFPSSLLQQRGADVTSCHLFHEDWCLLTSFSLCNQISAKHLADGSCRVYLERGKPQDNLTVPGRKGKKGINSLFWEVWTLPLGGERWPDCILFKIFIFYTCISQSQLAEVLPTCEAREAAPALFHLFAATIFFPPDFRRQYRRDLLLRQDVKLLPLDPG